MNVSKVCLIVYCRVRSIRGYNRRCCILITCVDIVKFQNSIWILYKTAVILANKIVHV